MPKVRDVIKRLEAEGWIRVVTRGSHRQYKYPNRPGRVTIAVHANDKPPPGTWNGVQNQAGWRQEPKP